MRGNVEIAEDSLEGMWGKLSFSLLVLVSK